MFKKISNEDEIRTYLDNLSILTNGATSVPSMKASKGLEKLVDVLDILFFKHSNNLANILSVSTSSGMPSYSEITDIGTECINTPIRAKHSYTHNQIRDLLISDFDAVSIQDLDDFNLDKYVALLQSTQYLSKLKGFRHPDSLSFGAHHVESGVSSDLVRVFLSGFKPLTETICDAELEVYFSKKGILKGNQFHTDANGKAHLSSGSRNNITRVLGSPSNVGFHLLDTVNGIEPRKIVRRVIGPFYTPNFVPDGIMRRIDPLCETLQERMLSEGYTNGILAIHTDTSTRQYNLFDELEDGVESEQNGSLQEGLQDPKINIESKYFVRRLCDAEFLADYVDPKNIVEVYNS